MQVTVAATQTAMRGHSAANVVPVIASNRIGREESKDLTMEFYGSSFITDSTGQMNAEADRSSECVLTAAIDLEEAREYRRSWGVFRDRRPDLYKPLLSLDGVNQIPL